MSDREKVIRALGCLTGNLHRAVTQQECRDSGCPYSGQDCEIAVMEDALKLLNGSGWISVKDRMPRNEEMVVCYTPCDGYMFVGFHRTYVSANYDWSAWYIITAMRSTKKITKKVTHWMPLPEGPKERSI